MTGKFDADKLSGEILKKCWMDIQQNRGERAELCRAKSLNDIILLPVFQRTCFRLRQFFQYEKHWQYRLASVIGLLAHVRDEEEKVLAEQMAGKGKPKPAISELRFRRLLQRDREELYTSMVRVLRLLNNKANLYDLANSVYYWGDRIKRDWAFAYFSNTQEPDKRST